jgi:hypothetical protein
LRLEADTWGVDREKRNGLGDTSFGARFLFDEGNPSQLKQDASLDACLIACDCGVLAS